ncbi:MAG: tpm [Cyanobacteria bacterium RYN_339]|nr:tpm [Cyanobacteria bacterium RYN_339]
MEPNFWHRKWEKAEIGFHQSEANPLLVKHFQQLGLAPGQRVFLPLCGKTLDLHWLLSHGCRVAGAELSKLAIDQLFAELGVTPEISREADLEHYHAPQIDIFVGDIFALTRDLLGPVDATYDRAALVALPQDLRNRYTAHLAAITNKAPQLLICFEYDQSLMDGPPFSVAIDEVKRQYGGAYRLDHLESVEVPGGMKGKVAATESVWHLA